MYAAIWICGCVAIWLLFSFEGIPTTSIQFNISGIDIISEDFWKIINDVRWLSMEISDPHNNMQKQRKRNSEQFHRNVRTNDRAYSEFIDILIFGWCSHWGIYRKPFDLQKKKNTCETTADHDQNNGCVKYVCERYEDAFESYHSRPVKSFLGGGMRGCYSQRLVKKRTLTNETKQRAPKDPASFELTPPRDRQSVNQSERRQSPDWTLERMHLGAPQKFPTPPRWARGSFC